MSKLYFVFLSFFLPLTTATELYGKVLWNNFCPTQASLGYSKIYLDGGYNYGGIRADGSFTISDVSSGTYILHVESQFCHFDQLRIDIQPNATVEVRPYQIGTPLNPPSSVILPYPIFLSPKDRYSFFIPHQSFNLLGMLKSPMVLMMVAGGFMMLAMPYMMKNMDPEALKEFQETQASAQSWLSKAQDRSLLSISDQGMPPASTPKGSTKGKGRNKRR